jgi:hypothetical protein
MSIAHDSPQSRSASVAHPIQSAASWRVRSVEVLPDYCFKVSFVDGLEGVVQMKKMVWSPEAGVFEVLRDPAIFAQAGVVFGVVTWPGELDLAPDAMYDEIKANGVWVLD